MRIFIIDLILFLQFTTSVKLEMMATPEQEPYISHTVGNTVKTLKMIIAFLEATDVRDI